MRPTNDHGIRKELEEIRQRHQGMLRPEDVVNKAESPSSALHGCFTWENDKAAHEYRLEQARHLIRVQVVVVKTPKGTVEVRAYVNLTSDRKESEGYRATVEVLGKDHLRERMLSDALAELDVFRGKYAALKELALVHKAIEVVLEKT